MTRPLKLEDFGDTASGDHVGPDPAMLTEDARLTAYEEGYKAGWDDAAAAEAQSQSRASADFAKTLQDLSFTYAQARAHVLDAIAPLLTLMADKVLPDLARDGFAQTVVELGRAAAETAANAPVDLIVSPANRAALERLLQDDAGLPLRIVEEPSLGPGQAFLRGGQGETALDIDAVIAGIRDAVAGFLTTEAEKETQTHG
ncbi:FliH/SctL family protein [Actibacterium sp. D379-3]